MLESAAELDHQARRIATLDLLVSLELSAEAVRATGARVLVDVIEELAALAR